MVNEKIFQLKEELMKMTKRNLLEIGLSQREKNCVLGGVCRFLLEYRRILFCVSEILGQGCQMEKLRVVFSNEEEHGKEHKTPLFVYLTYPKGVLNQISNQLKASSDRACLLARQFPV